MFDFGMIKEPKRLGGAFRIVVYLRGCRPQIMVGCDGFSVDPSKEPGWQFETLGWK